MYSPFASVGMFVMLLALLLNDVKNNSVYIVEAVVALGTLSRTVQWLHESSET